MIGPSPLDNDHHHVPERITIGIWLSTSVDSPPFRLMWLSALPPLPLPPVCEDNVVEIHHRHGRSSG